MLRWALTNSGLHIKASQDFETHLNRNRDSTGSLNKISVMSSTGKIGILKLESCTEVDGNRECFMGLLCFGCCSIWVAEFDEVEEGFDEVLCL